MNNYEQSQKRMSDQLSYTSPSLPNLQQQGSFAAAGQVYNGGNTQHDQYHDQNQSDLFYGHNWPPYDQGYVTQDTDQFDTTQYSSLPRMGVEVATQEIGWEPLDGGPMRGRLSNSGPSNIAGHIPDTAGDVEVSMPEGQPSGFAVEQEPILVVWYNSNHHRKPNAEERRALALLTRLSEEVIGWWFREKVTHATDAISPIQNQPTGSQIGFARTAASRPFEAGQRPIRSHLSSTTRKVLGESSHMDANHQIGHSEVMAQHVISSGNHTPENSNLGPVQANHLPYPEQSYQIVIENYLAKSRNKCHSSRQPKKAGGMYPCTSKCGQTFSKTGCWARHEQINHPQQFYVCVLCGKESTSELFIHHRKDKLVQHMSAAHPNDKPTPDDQCPVEHSHTFEAKCGFCGLSFGSWSGRCSHVSRHFDGKIDKRSLDDWQDPWVDLQEGSSPPDEVSDGPSNEDPNNPDGSSGNAGAGTSTPNQRDGFGSGSGSGSSSGNNRTSRGSGSRYKNGQSMWVFQQSGDLSRIDSGDLCLCSGRKSCHRHHSDTAFYEGGCQERSPKSGTLFHKLDLLGFGLHSVVEKVQYVPTGSMYARKTLHNPGKSISTSQQFLAEVEIMKLLNHLHIIRFAFDYTDHLSRHVIMSPVADYSLKDFIEDPGRLPHNRFLLETIGCLASALAYLHSVRIRHNDIKPQNILVKDSTVLLSDFGISKTWSDTQSTSESISAMTPMYAAPEVATHEKHGSKADVFSLGLVFLEIIAVTNEGSTNTLRDLLSKPQESSMARNLSTDDISCRKPKVKPYSAGIHLILSWIKSRRSYCVSRMLVPLDLCQAMVQRDPKARPTASALFRNVPPIFMCDSCSSGGRRGWHSAKVQQIALSDPFTSLKSLGFLPGFILPDAVSMGTRNRSAHFNSMPPMCDISWVKLFAQTIDQCKANSLSDVGYIIGRRPLFLGNLLQWRRDAKRVFDTWSSFEESASEHNKSYTSTQCAAQSRLTLHGSLDPHSLLSECGSSLDYQNWDWTSSEYQSTIDLGDPLLLEDPSLCDIRRNADLDEILGLDSLSFVDTTNAELRWWDIMYADSWTMLRVF